MTTRNPHAHLMMEFTERLIDNPDEYKNWEQKGTNLAAQWGPMVNPPMWSLCLEYRRIAEYITIGNMEVLAPMRVAPKDGKFFYAANPRNSDLCTFLRWTDCDLDRIALKQGMCHETKEAAKAHAKAIIIASGGKVRE